MTNTVDPTGGSEYIESLTDSIERGALEELKRIDDLGGTLRAIETGYIQNQIHNAAYAYQRAVESGERVVVGVNRFQQHEPESAPTFRIDPARERAQIDQLRQMRASRSQAAVEGKLAALGETARGEGNLMPPILEAAEVYATVGEISGVLREAFGAYREV